MNFYQHSPEQINQLADALEDPDLDMNGLGWKAAFHLRELQGRIFELEAQLYAIGAGGVEPLRKTDTAAQALKQGEQVAPYTGDVPRIMREAGMTFHLGLPHKAVVEQMTRVVDLVYAEASIKAAVAFAAPKPAAQPDTAPAAWAIFSKDGTAMVMWSRDMPSAKNTAEKLGLPLVPLYAAPKPTENLNCKSTQKRLATLWGYVKQEPARQPLPADTYTALAHRIATRFTYSTDRSFCEYYFAIHTLEQFVRAIEQAHGITVGQ